MVSKNLISGVELSDVDNFFCEACMYGKQHKLSFAPSKHIKAKLEKHIHSDLRGQSPFRLFRVLNTLHCLKMTYRAIG